MDREKPRLVVTAGLAAVAVLAVACGGAKGNGTIHASGHIEATEVRLAAKVGGRLLELPYREGEPIAAGAVVARFDTVDAEHELARARAELDGADAALRLLLAGTRVEDLRQAEQELARAQAELDAAERDVKRLEPLAERGTATVKARDDARTRRDVATRATAAARAALDRLVAGPRAQEIDAARARRAAVEATVAGISQRIADMTVTAPRAGVITGRTAEPGEVLPAGAPLSVLTDLAEPWLTVYVDQPSLSRFALGDAVEVRVDGRQEAFTGRVTFVSPVAEFTPKNVQTPAERAKLVFRVKITLDNRDGVFKPGMPADAYFTSTRQPTAGSSPLTTDTAPAPVSTVGGRPTVVASAGGSHGTRSNPAHALQDGLVVRASCPHRLVLAAGTTALHSVRAGRPHHNVTGADGADGFVVRASCPHRLDRPAGTTALHSVRAGRPHHDDLVTA